MRGKNGYDKEGREERRQKKRIGEENTKQKLDD